MGLKATGAYISRSLSYDGAEFSVAEVSMDAVMRCHTLCLLRAHNRLVQFTFLQELAWCHPASLTA